MGKPREAFLILLMVVATGLVFYLFSAFFASLFAAVVVAALLDPIQHRFSRRLGDRPRLSAGLLTTALIFIVLIPAAVLTILVIQQTTELITEVQKIVREDGRDGLVAGLPEFLRPMARETLRVIPDDLLPQGEGGWTAPELSQEEGGSMPSVSQVAGTAGAVFSAGSRVLANIGVLILGVFFVLCHGRLLVDYIVSLLPLEERRSRSMLHDFREVSVGVIFSTFGTGAIQTATAVVGHIIAGTPALLLVVAATFFASFVPVIGGAGMTIATGLILLIAGETWQGVFIIIWGAGLVSTIDNFVKPWLAKHRAQLHYSLIFFSMIGGLAIFGAIGLIVGPLIVALFKVTADMFRQRFGNQPLQSSAYDPSRDQSSLVQS
ncbi:MAG: AI-2E family transporter [Planctomycetota bacterium]